MLMRNQQDGRPEALVFCKWFMERGMSAQFPDGSTFNSGFMNRLRAYRAKFGTAGKVAIDLFYLFNSTFMHEVGVPTVTQLGTQEE